MTEKEKQCKVKGKAKMVLTVGTSLMVQTSEPGKKKKVDEARLEAIDELKSVEVVAGKPTKTVKIGAQLALILEKLLVEFTRENYDVFVWKVDELPGIPEDLVVYRLNVDPTARPIK